MASGRPAKGEASFCRVGDLESEVRAPPGDELKVERRGSAQVFDHPRRDLVVLNANDLAPHEFRG